MLGYGTPIRSSTNRSVVEKLFYYIKAWTWASHDGWYLPKILKVMPVWLFAANLNHRIAHWYDILPQTKNATWDGQDTFKQERVQKDYNGISDKSNFSKLHAGCFQFCDR